MRLQDAIERISSCEEGKNVTFNEVECNDLMQILNETNTKITLLNTFWRNKGYLHLISVGNTHIYYNGFKEVIKVYVEDGDNHEVEGGEISVLSLIDKINIAKTQYSIVNV